MRYTVEGPPVRQERHRVSKWGGMYDPSAKEKKTLAMWLSALVKGPKPSIPGGDVYLDVTFYLPKGKYRRKPDLDNFLKGFMDAANGILWTDDSQVTKITAFLIRDCNTPLTVFSIDPV